MHVRAVIQSQWEISCNFFLGTKRTVVVGDPYLRFIKKYHTIIVADYSIDIANSQSLQEEKNLVFYLSKSSNLLKYGLCKKLLL